MNNLLARFRRRSRQVKLTWGRLRRDLAWFVSGRSLSGPILADTISQRKWLFLVGCNNSGTTILHDLLVSTEQFSALPHEGQRYTRQLAIAERRGFERVWTEYLTDLQMTEADGTDIVSRLVYDWLFEASPKNRALFIEKTTANAVRMRWLQKAFPNSYFIGVIRNGFAVAEGIRRKGKKDIARAARHWNRVNELMLRDSRLIRHFLQLRYEDVVAAPQDTVSKVAEFLGYSPGFHASPVACEHLVDMNEDSLIQLTMPDREAILTEAGPLLREFGYAD